ncbi:hypothetical protein HPB50_020055 [Hyalomma asiaticum]|uniref:Uncharacterized protein n=1 Tax=Hyalomma asiaticum TaxID=266040 RepID=A0ACB7S9W8_HYAAI|nr:hypothetical protein HPB50_020055 [Hyalomma asiaticum]
MEDQASAPPVPTPAPANEGGKKSRRKKSRLLDRPPTPGVRSLASEASPDRTRRTPSGPRIAASPKRGRSLREYRRPTSGNRIPSSGTLRDKAPLSSSGALRTPTVKTLRPVRDHAMPQRLMDDYTTTPVPSRSLAVGTAGTRVKTLQSRPTSSSSATKQGVRGAMRRQDVYAEESVPPCANGGDSTPCDGTPRPQVQDTTSASLTQVQPSEGTGAAEKADSSTKGQEDALKGTTMYARADEPSKETSGLEIKVTPSQPNKPRSPSLTEAKPKEELPATSSASLVRRIRDALSRPGAEKAQQKTGHRATDKSLSSAQQTQASYYLMMKDLATSHHPEPDETRWRSVHSIPYGLPRFHWTCAVLVAFVIVVAALTLLSPLWGRRPSVRSRDGACVNDHCFRLASFLARSLNFSAEPCTDFNAFVCHQWKPKSDFTFSFEVEMSRKHMQRMGDLLLHGSPHYNVSAKSAMFMRTCTRHTEHPEYLKQLSDFAKQLGIPWPYDKKAARAVDVKHPLHIVFELSVKWGIYTWFDVVLRAFDIETRAGRAFYIQVGDNPTSSLNVVRILKSNNARDRYYGDFCRLYKVECQSGPELQRLFEIEESVLSLLDSAVDQGRNRIARMRPKKLEALTRNVTLADWTHLVTVFAPEFKKPLHFPFYFGNKILLVAIDQVFYKHKREDLMAHLAWWFVQQHTVLGSPSGHLIFAGNSENAAKLMVVDCYDMASEKLGLLLAAESAVSLFTVAERHHVTNLLRSLNELAIKVVYLLPWSENGRRYVASKIAGLDVVLFPENLDHLDEYLSDVYGPFLNTNDSLFTYWFDASVTLQRLNDTDYEFMQYRWRTYTLELIDYDYWTNQLRVTHGALEVPMFSASDAAVLRAATYGGLAAFYLSRILGIMNPSIIKADKKNAMSQRVGLDIIDMTLKSWECGSAFDGFLSESVALEAAWHAFKHFAPSNAKGTDYLLGIQEHFFTEEQVFFIVYCLSLCDKEVTDPCNAILKSFAPFSKAFRCGVGTPMHVPDRCGIVSELRDKMKNVSLGETRL